METKFKKAIDVLKIAKRILSDEKSKEGLDAAIEACERQIAQQGVPYNSQNNHLFIECPHCHRDMGMYSKHCSHCGQNVEWGEHFKPLMTREDAEVKTAIKFGLGIERGKQYAVKPYSERYCLVLLNDEYELRHRDIFEEDFVDFRGRLRDCEKRK